MRTAILICGLAAALLLSPSSRLAATGLPVVTGHPRLLLTSAIKGQLLTRKNAADPRWEKLRGYADVLKTYTIFPYKYNQRSSEPDNTIFYDYQGSGWYSAAMPLALAFQVSGDTAYSNKLIALADEMIRAQSDPANLPPNGFSPIAPDDYYGTRYVCPVLAIIYDWCYDQLGAQRRASMVTLMNAYFDDLRINAYQRNSPADGNYFTGHLFAAASMGYASFGDNPRAQEMIDYARIRFDNTPSSLLADSVRPDDYFAQLFEGGFLSALSRDYNGLVISSAPFKGGFDFQGWAYGTGTFNRIIDYMQMVRTATAEDLFAARGSWFSQILRAMKHGLMPNRFEIDPTGDWGSDYGAVIIRSLPIRLAYLLAGTPDGPGAQHFAYAEIAATSPIPDFPDNIYQQVYQPETWEDFYFTDTTRPSQELTLPPYHSGFGPEYPQAGLTNGARPYFYMRSDWGPSATWSTINMGAAWYDDHQHTNAGHLEINRGGDYLLIDASSWKGDSGSNGIVGSSLEEQYSPTAVANTLFFDDFGDFQWPDAQYHGGQGAWGMDEVIAAGQNDAYSYVRSDLSTAYNRTSDSTDQGGRKLEHFYRSFLYLRGANLFLSYDQVKVKTSTNARGQYHKHIRWHFPSRPTIASNTVHVEKGESQLNMTMLLPQLVAITPINEMNNPDPCDGTVTPCTPYGMNSGTWRIEVRDSLNRLEVPFLTVIEPGAKSSQRSSALNITSVGGEMIGARIIAPGGHANIVLFNNGQGQTPTPVTSVTYATPNAMAASHTLCGVAPGTRYAVTISSDSIVTVTQNATGRLLSSSSGVLQFDAVSLGVNEGDNTTAMDLRLEPNHPNPFNGVTTIGFTIPAAGRVTLNVFDALGREMATLADGRLEAGHHQIDFYANDLPAGVYTYMLQCNGRTQAKEMVVVR